MEVLYNMKLMVFHDGTILALNVKSQERHELIVERHGHAHVLDGYFNVVNDRFHSSLTSSLVWRSTIQIGAPTPLFKLGLAL